MAFKMKGFPTHKGVSPINKLDDPSAGDQSSFIEDADNANPAGDFSFIKNTTNGITTKKQQKKLMKKLMEKG